MALAPVYAACLLGLLVAAFAFGRKDVAGRPYRVPLLWFGALAVVSLLVLEHVQGAGAVLASETVVKALGSVLLVLAAGLALRGAGPALGPTCCGVRRRCPWMRPWRTCGLATHRAGASTTACWTRRRR
nr:hypothetical protein [Corallococcus macrosporus]